MDRAAQLREEEKADHTMRRTNRRSSWAQLNQRDAQDSLNNAIDKIQESLRKGSVAAEVKVTADNLRTSSQGRKDGLSKQILLELQSSFLAVEETSQGLLDKLSQEAEPASEHTTFIKVNTFGSKKFGRCDYEDSESEDSGRDDEIERDPEEPITFKAEMAGGKRGNIDKIARAANIIEKTLLLGPLESYVTATQRGMLKLWSANTLKPLRAVPNGDGAWITDMVAMAHQPLAVFALDRSITFYDTGRLSFDVLGRIQNLVNAPMCATWLRVAENDKLLYGDDQGIVHTYTFADEWGGDSDKGFGIADKVLPPGITENIPWILHSDWVTRIRFLAHSNSLLTASMDGNLFMLDFEKRVAKWTAKEHTHGIYGCEYCRSYNFIVTCGLERYINIWNPFTAKLMGVLHGHEASVMDVVVNETDNQIVSIGADSVIKVWDMRSSRCLQTIVEKADLPTRNNIMYDNQRHVQYILSSPIVDLMATAHHL